MFYLIEDNTARLSDDYLVESILLSEGELAKKIGSHMLGKKVEITKAEAKSYIPKIEKALDIYFDTCMKYAGKLSFYFRKNVDELKAEHFSKIKAKIEKGIEKGKFTITVHLPLPVFQKDADLSRIKSPFKQICTAVEKALPETFSVGIGLNRGIGTDFSASHMNQVWIASERIVIKD